jgi:quercetin dioxygenase-like cupin family protein
VSTLYAIVSALELSLDRLFATGGGAALPGRPGRAAPPPPDSLVPFIRRAEQGDAIEFSSGVNWKRLSEPNDVVELLWITYATGGTSNAAGEFMRHAGREYGVVISGRLGVSIGFETYELQAGDAVSFQSSVPHHLSALGDAPAVAVWFVLRWPET